MSSGLSLWKSLVLETHCQTYIQIEVFPFCCPPNQNCTWFNIQRTGVDLDVQVLGGSGAELLQDTVDGLGDVVRHWFGELHLAVDDHAAFSEVKNLQFLEAREVCLQVRQQLETEGGNHFVVCFCHFKHFWFLDRVSLRGKKLLNIWRLIWY